jgi:hypothetical protein
MTTVAEELARAVRAWLEGLDDVQRERAMFPFDTAERFVWAYTPGPREGLAISDMRADQHAAASAVVATATSSRTATEIAAIMALETVLGDLERAEGRRGSPRRDPQLYWFAVFGEPGSTDPWSWRLGGHHVAIHQTVDEGEVIGVTPSFLGANPAIVPRGPLAGTRTLPGEEQLARGLLSVLTPAERDIAIVEGTAPADILSGIGRHADVRSVPVGIRHADLASQSQARLERLIRHYVDRAQPDVADASWDRIVAGGLGDVTFAWSGPDEPGRGHYYAIRGPGFVVEYDNTQNGANHVHAVWRELANDWGEDLLARHVATTHAPGDG